MGNQIMSYQGKNEGAVDVISYRVFVTQDLVMMLSFTMTRRETENQKLLFNEICKSLERRWVEIKSKLEESCQT